MAPLAPPGPPLEDQRLQGSPAKGSVPSCGCPPSRRSTHLPALSPPPTPGQGRAAQDLGIHPSLSNFVTILIERQGTRLGAASRAAGASRPGLSGMALVGSHDLLGRRGSEPRISLCTPPPTCSPLRSSGPPFLQPLLLPRALGGERDGSDTQTGPKAGTLPTHGSLPSFHTRFIHEGTRWGGGRRL